MHIFSGPRSLEVVLYPTGRAAQMTEATAFDVSRSQWLLVDENFLIWLSGSPHRTLRQ